MLYNAFTSNLLDKVTEKVNLAQPIDKFEQDLLNRHFLYAVETGNFTLAAIYLVSGADIKCQDSEGYTALNYAVSHQKMEEVKWLLEHGADVNYQDSAWDTALLLACRDGKIRTAEILLAHGADIGPTNVHGYNCLTIASERGYTNIVKLLIRHGADLNSETKFGETALSIAISNNHPQIVEILEKAQGERATSPSSAESENRANSMGRAEYYGICTLQSCMDAWSDLKAETCNMLYGLPDDEFARSMLNTFKIWSSDTEQEILNEIPDRGDCEIFRYLFWRWCRYEAGRIRGEEKIEISCE